MQGFPGIWSAKFSRNASSKKYVVPVKFSIDSVGCLPQGFFEGDISPFRKPWLALGLPQWAAMVSECRRTQRVAASLGVHGGPCRLQCNCASAASDLPYNRL